MKVERAGRILYVECKRMSRVSDYTIAERKHIRTMWHQLSQGLKTENLQLCLEIVFHRDVLQFDPEFLMNLLAPKAPLIVFPCTMIDDENLTIRARPTDMTKLRQLLRTDEIRVPGSKFEMLVMGDHDPNSMFFFDGDFQVSKRHFSLVTSVRSLRAARIRCDSDAGRSAKARLVLQQMAGAAKQIPQGSTGIVHIGIEAIEGEQVERQRFKGILEVVQGFVPRRTIDWVYTHMFVWHQSTLVNWVMDETVDYRPKSKPAMPEPLGWRPALLPPDTAMQEGPHFDMDPPEL